MLLCTLTALFDNNLFRINPLHSQIFGGLAVSEFLAQWENAAERLSGPAMPSNAAAMRIELWRRQEWHDWFRWRLCLKDRDWSKPIWFVTLGGGLLALVLYGLFTERWFVTAGGIVAWFTVVNLGFFSYLGLRTRHPPLPLPGPFEPNQRVRARMGLYPAGYDGRSLARMWLKVANASGGEWLCEMALPSGLSSEFVELVKRQDTFRMQRGDAPAMRAVCEMVPLTREQIDAGEHPLKAVAWDWDEKCVELFGLPKF